VVMVSSSNNKEALEILSLSHVRVVSSRPSEGEGQELSLSSGSDLFED
jgi:hypothetical protein